MYYLVIIYYLILWWLFNTQELIIKDNIIYLPNSSKHLDLLYSKLKNKQLDKNYTYVISHNKNIEKNYYKYNRHIFTQLPENRFINHKKELWKSLYKHYKNDTKNITPTTYTFPEEYDKYSIECKNKKMILKSNTHRQEGLFVTSNIQSKRFIELEKIIVAQTFMNDSLMYDNRKITPRLYLIVEIRSNNTECYLYNDGLVYYSNKDKDIASFYDSESLYKKNPLLISEFVKKTNIDIYDSMKKTMNYLISLIKNRKYETNIKNRYYELFGVDFHITPENRAYILEVNSGPGMTPTNMKDKLFRDKIIEWYLRKIIK